MTPLSPEPKFEVASLKRAARCDLTGLTGKYDIDLSWTPDPAFEPAGGNSAPEAAHANAAGASAATADLFTALRESLGLRLERRNVQVEFVVIDRIERRPTEN